MLSRSMIILVLAATSCGYRPARFVDRPLVVDARDERPVPMPRPRRSLEELYWAEAYGERGVADSLEVARPPLAKDVNRMDEVVRSSWFRGHPGPDPLDDFALDGPPEPPFAPLSKKWLEIEPSISIRDARGLSYQLVLDDAVQPETRSAAMAIAARLAFAMGYRVPEMHVIDGPGGQRAAAVRWPPGRDLGPTPMLWTRPDDPNDVLKHEDRRTLRVTGVLAAWLGIGRFGEHMFRDAYIGHPGHGFVRHHLVGFEGALGAGRLDDALDDAFDGSRDDTGAGWLLLTLGFHPKPAAAPPTSTGLLGVGLYSSHVSLREHTVSPPHPAHDRMRPDDAYWFAKRMMALDEATLDRAVAAGKLSREQARRYLRSAIAHRRRALAREIFAQVTPVDVVALRTAAGGDAVLVLVDEAVRGLRLEGQLRYCIDLRNLEGEALAPVTRTRARDDRFVVRLSQRLLLRHGTVIARIAKMDGVRCRARTVDVHVLRDAAGVRLLGVEH